jgi:hypothetical protein
MPFWSNLICEVLYSPPRRHFLLVPSCTQERASVASGSVAGVASVPQAEHREDGKIVLDDGFRQPICDGASKSPSIPW